MHPSAHPHTSLPYPHYHSTPPHTVHPHNHSPTNTPAFQTRTQITILAIQLTFPYRYRHPVTHTRRYPTQPSQTQFPHTYTPTPCNQNTHNIFTIPPHNLLHNSHTQLPNNPPSSHNSSTFPQSTPFFIHPNFYFTNQIQDPKGPFRHTTQSSYNTTSLHILPYHSRILNIPLPTLHTTLSLSSSLNTQPLSPYIQSGTESLHRQPFP